MRYAWYCALLTIWLAACHDSPAASNDAAGGVASRPHAPLSPTELRTTNGALAIDNLQGQIEGEQRLAKRRPLTVAQRAGIIDLIAMRGQFLGRVADYERADELAIDLVRDHPADGLSHLARAKTHAIFHRFPAAVEALRTAESLGAPAHQIELQRAGILQAVGQYDEALEIRRRAAARKRDIGTLTLAASVLSERGDITAAEESFVAAQFHYRDVSPFPVAWLYFVQGQMWMREGNFMRARELFAAAHERLPAYAAARGHLAEAEAALGNRGRAIELLRPLAETSDDADYAAQLSRILADDGRHEEADRWRAVAAENFERLTTLHPEAFADHAAEFWLAAGADPRKALTLARRNVEVRPTPRAYELLLQAGLAANDRDATCRAVVASSAVARPAPGLRDVLSRAREICAS